MIKVMDQVAEEKNTIASVSSQIKHGTTITRRFGEVAVLYEDAEGSNMFYWVALASPENIIGVRNVFKTLTISRFEAAKTIVNGKWKIVNVEMSVIPAE